MTTATASTADSASCAACGDEFQENGRQWGLLWDGRIWRMYPWLPDMTWGPYHGGRYCAGRELARRNSAQAVLPETALLGRQVQVTLYPGENKRAVRVVRGVLLSLSEMGIVIVEQDGDVSYSWPKLKVELDE